MASGKPGSGPSPLPVRFSETEQRVLQLYDSLQELQLELALLGAQQTPLQVDSPRDVNDSQMHLLEAKAALSLRNSVLEGVMMIQPLLEAIHNGTQTSPVERDISPCAQQRDMTAAEAAKQSSDLRQTQNHVTDLEVEAHQLGRLNVALASDVLRFAATDKAHEMEALDDVHLKRKMAELETEVKTSRQRWKVIKGATSAVVAGSGVDWVRDRRLRDMVLDPPDG
ncbi:centromere protein H (CENP-H)-domain-containing protein [Apodospora peruviana]|uniref:Centromere protein H (CENP-H)-domain-containing protein n=1 Tax=Apodospora peruviana TaxID=516989 RepID=A0AAE0ISR9_9PEZI|nr:centromere protein H (CENP-H)-domain-containing protein [Apodospora peruviana]